MKKIILFASAIAAMFAVSCQREDIKTVTGEVPVTISLELPKTAAQTKAMSMAEQTDIVYYEIWNSNWSKKLYPADGVLASAAVTADANGVKTATLDLTLVSNQTYNFIFWAQNENCGAYTVTDLKKVAVDYSVIAAPGNQDKFDAFYAVEDITVTGPINETVTLTRPFSQLNFGASVMATTLGDVTVGATSVSVSQLATEFNTIDGVGETPTAAPVVFAATGLATDEKLEVSGEKYAWVSMNYMLTMAQQSVVEVEAEFNLGMDLPVEHSLLNVPLKKNHRTNVVGNLFTAGAVLNIVVDPSFNQPDENVAAPVVVVANAADLKEAIAAGKNVTITQDIDLVADELHVADGKNVVVDINGKTLTVKSLDPIDNSGTMTLKNGKVVAENSVNTRRCVYNREGGVMTIENVEFVQTYPLKGAAINNAGTMTIESAKVAAEYFAIWNEEDGVLTINGGEFVSRTTSPNEPQYCVILKDSSKLYVNGGTFEGGHGVVDSEAQSAAYLYAGTYTCTGNTSSDWVLYANGENEGGVVYYTDSCVLNNNGKNNGICGNVILMQ